MEQNKRLALAIVLAIAAVLATRVLFPSRPTTPAPTATGTTATPTPAAGPAATVTPVPSPAPGVAAAETPTVAMPVDVPVESVTVAGARAAYTVSSLGASLVGAEMRQFRSLAPASLGGGQPVQLAPAGAPLIGYRLVVPGDTLSLARTVFRVTRGGAPGAETVQLDGVATSRTGTQIPVSFRYAFTTERYVVNVSGRVQGIAGGYLLVDMPPALRITEKDTIDHYTHLAYAFKPEKKDAKSTGFSRIDPGERQIVPGPLTWVAAKSKYFLVGALAPEGKTFSELDITGGVRTTKIATHANATLVQSLGDGTFSFDVYAGPLAWRQLAAMGRDFENANPYGGWLQGVVQPFATLVIRSLLWMHDVLKLSYGWVLVVFGIVIRLLLWPLQQNTMRTQLKMQRVQPELQAVQQRYKGDPARAQQEMMKVYAAHNMSPFSALSGCLPMLIPLPIFFALFFVFQNTIEFRGVSFLWLADISVKDPYYVLPILVAVTQFLMSWIGMRGLPPNPQTQMLTYAMPAMFLFFFINVASGLNLYYLTQNFIMLPQQWLLARERQKMPAPVVQGTPAPSKKKG